LRLKGKDMNFIQSGQGEKRFQNDVIRLLIFSLALKMIYLVFAFFTLDDPSILSFEGYTRMIQRNDSGWYEIISNKWYPEIASKSDLGFSHGAEFKQSEWAFFPFYPALNRILMLWLGIEFSLSGFIYSLLFSSVTFAGFYWFCRNYTGDPGRSFFYSLLLMLYPFHYYFSMMYTEAVYFAFLIFSFLSIYKRKYLFLPVLIIPLVLVRPNGIIGLIPLYIYYLERNTIISKKSVNYKLLLSWRIIMESMLFLTGPVVFIIYGFYQVHMTGYYFAFSIAQTGWYRELMWPFMSLFRRGDFTTQFNSVYTLVFILLAVISWKRFPLSLNILIWTGLLLPLCSGSVTSMPRFISVIFPFTILIGDGIYSSKYRNYFLGLLFILQLLVFHFWLTGHPFSC
jgi:hypothetical protein